LGVKKKKKNFIRRCTTMEGSCKQNFIQYDFLLPKK